VCVVCVCVRVCVCGVCVCVVCVCVVCVCVCVETWKFGTEFKVDFLAGIYFCTY